MALYEYRCTSCGTVSEHLVRDSGDAPVCPNCGSTDLEKLLSSFAVSASQGTTATPAPSCQSGCCGGACSM